MTEVVYNACYGGFGLSDAAFEEWLKRKGIEYFANGEGWHRSYVRTSDGKHISYYDIPRDDTDLVAIVKEMGDKASGQCAKLAIRDVGDRDWEIDEYDGFESVVGPRSWS